MQHEPNLKKLLPEEDRKTFNDNVDLTLGVGAPKKWKFTKGYLRLLQLLFPNRMFQPRNTGHPVIPTHDENGKRVDVYVRRALQDLLWREQGKIRPKGFTIETENGDPFDLRVENLKPIPAKTVHRKNGWVTHNLIGIRLDALLRGECPDEAMEKLIAANRARRKTNDKC